MHLIQEDVLALLLGRRRRVQHLPLCAGQNLDSFFFPGILQQQKDNVFHGTSRGMRVGWGDNRGGGAYSERMSLCLGSQHGYVIHASRTVFLLGP